MAAHHAPLCLGFSRQEYWSGLPFPSSPMHACMLSCFSHVQLCEPLDCSPPGSSVHRILQARILECHFLLLFIFTIYKSVSVQFSPSVVSDSLWPHGLQHTRPSCPSPTPGVYSNSCPLSQWCHPTISSSVISFSSCLKCFPASGSFQMSRFFESGGQSIGLSASASVLPMNIQDWFPLGLTGWICLQSKGLSRVFSNTTVQKDKFFRVKLSLYSNSHIHTGQLEKP